VEGSFPLAVRFGEGSHAIHRHKALFGLADGAEHSFYVHPTQLYSSLTAFTIFVLVSLYFHATRHRRVNGEVFTLVAVLYPVGRFILEAFREDTDTVFGTGLTISQNISILILLAAVPLFVWVQVVKFRKAKGAEEPPKDQAGTGEARPPITGK